MTTEVSLVKHAATPPEDAVLVDLPLSSIGVLRQMRTMFNAETLQELAKSVGSKGQMSPGVVAALKKADAVQYVQGINATWRTKYKLSSFFVNEKSRSLGDGSEWHIFLTSFFPGSFLSVQ